MDVILAASDKTKLKEVLQRMNAGETSLHSKVVGPLKIFRLKTLPILLAELLASDLKRGRLVAVKRSKEILICERKTV